MSAEEFAEYFENEIEPQLHRALRSWPEPVHEDAIGHARLQAWAQYLDGRSDGWRCPADYLVQVARNEAQRLTRERQRESPVTPPEEERDGRDPLELLKDRGNGPGRSLADPEILGIWRKRIADSLAQTTETQRAATVLRILYRLPASTIGELLGIAPSAANARVKSAFERLRPALKDLLSQLQEDYSAPDFGNGELRELWLHGLDGVQEVHARQLAGGVIEELGSDSRGMVRGRLAIDLTRNGTFHGNPFESGLAKSLRNSWAYALLQGPESPHLLPSQRPFPLELHDRGEDCLVAEFTASFPQAAGLYGGLPADWLVLHVFEGQWLSLIS